VLQIEFVLRGEKVEIAELANKAERAVLEEVARSLESRAGSLRCAEHDAGPRITVSGAKIDDLDFDLSGCCQALIDRTVAALT
jgi:hypothetical protein